jgi:hypothetical protein
MAGVDPKILTLRKLEAGDHEVLDGDGNRVGVIKHKHLMDHIRNYQEGFDRFSSAGFGDHTSSVDRELMRRTQRLMNETGLPVVRAMAQVLASDESLADKYRRAHTPVDDAEEAAPRSARGVVMADAEGTARVSKWARVLASRRRMTFMGEPRR